MKSQIGRLVVVIASLMLASLSCAQGVVRVYVLADSGTWSKLDKAPKPDSSVSAVESYFQKRSFVRATADNGALEFFYAPKIWPKEALEKSIQAFKEAAGVGAGGLVEPGKCPALRAMAGAAFKSFFGLGSADGAALAVSGETTIRIENGGRTFDCKVGPGPSKTVLAALDANPVPPRDPSSAPASADEGFVGIAPPPFTDYHFEAYGKEATDGWKRSAALRTACDLREDGIKAAVKLMESAKSELFAALVKSGVAMDTSGILDASSVGSLPMELAHQMEGDVAGNYAKYGFGSDTEAAAWVNNARIVSVTKSVTVIGARTGGGLVALGLG